MEIWFQGLISQQDDPCEELGFLVFPADQDTVIFW
jgi:hypothetical protein